MKVEHAVGELAQEYEGRIEFVVIPAEETAQRKEEIDSYGFTALKHGLVAFSSGGEVVAKLPGHAYGKEEIRAVAEQLLKADKG